MAIPILKSGPKEPYVSDEPVTETQDMSAATNLHPSSRPFPASRSLWFAVFLSLAFHGLLLLFLNVQSSRRAAGDPTLVEMVDTRVSGPAPEVRFFLDD